MFGGLRRPGDQRVAEVRSPVFRGPEGELWFDPALADEDVYISFEPFHCFEHCGAVYELWGKRPDGCWWVGRVSSTDVPIIPGASRPPVDHRRPAYGRLSA